MVVTEGLTRTYNGVNAVDGLNLSVPAGGIYGFLGPNGAGKSTTMKLLLGLTRPTSGSMSVLGRPVSQRHPLPPGTIGSLIEGPSYYPSLTGKENLAMVASYLGLASNRVQHALATVNLVGQENKQVKHYSMGMKQRLGLAMALLSNPALMLLDEPTNGLDPDIALTVRTLIRSLAEDGTAVLLTSHLLGEIEDLAHTITVLGAGSVAVSGSLEDIAAHAGIAATTVVQVEATATEGLDTLRGFLGDKAAVLFAPRGSGWELTLYWHGERTTFEAGEAHRILAEGLAASNIGARTEPYTRPATLEEAYLAMAEGLKR